MVRKSSLKSKNLEKKRKGTFILLQRVDSTKKLPKKYYVLLDIKRNLRLIWSTTNALWMIWKGSLSKAISREYSKQNKTLTVRHEPTKDTCYYEEMKSYYFTSNQQKKKHQLRSISPYKKPSPTNYSYHTINF